MITEKTAIVLGAGASAPYGFPTGRDLLFLIDRLMGKMKFLDFIMENYNDQYKYVSKMAESLLTSNQESIDAYLGINEDQAILGKIAIAHVLLGKENPDQLRRVYDMKWLEYLFQQMDGGKPESLLDNQISFITFNYERSLEYALMASLKYSYSLSWEDAGTIIAQLPIYHVYGKLGSLPEFNEQNPVNFGSAISKGIIGDIIESLTLVNEDREHYQPIWDARRVLRNVDRVLFMGFAYHHQNWANLGLENLEVLPENYPLMLGHSYNYTHTQISRMNRELGGDVIKRSPNGETEYTCLEFLRNNL